MTAVKGVSDMGGTWSYTHQRHGNSNGQQSQKPAELSTGSPRPKPAEAAASCTEDKWPGTDKLFDHAFFGPFKDGSRGGMTSKFSKIAGLM